MQMRVVKVALLFDVLGLASKVAQRRRAMLLVAGVLPRFSQLQGNGWSRSPKLMQVALNKGSVGRRTPNRCNIGASQKVRPWLC